MDINEQKATEELHKAFPPFVKMVSEQACQQLMASLTFQQFVIDQVSRLLMRSDTFLYRTSTAVVDRMAVDLCAKLQHDFAGEHRAELNRAMGDAKRSTKAWLKNLIKTERDQAKRDLSELLEKELVNSFLEERRKQRKRSRGPC